MKRCNLSLENFRKVACTTWTLSVDADAKIKKRLFPFYPRNIFYIYSFIYSSRCIYLITVTFLFIAAASQPLLIYIIHNSGAKREQRKRGTVGQPSTLVNPLGFACGSLEAIVADSSRPIRNRRFLCLRRRDSCADRKSVV